MIEKLSEQEILRMEMWYDPTACTENLIPNNIKAPHTWDENCETVKVRNYQFPFQNYSYLIANDPKRSPKQNFDKKRLSGTVFNIAARDIGKSFFIFIDTFLTAIHEVGNESLLASCTDEKLKKVSQTILNLFRDHPFFNMFKKVGKIDGIKAQPIEIQTQLGHTIYGRNEKIEDPEPGTQFHGIHAKTIFYEEFSYATKKGTEKRIDSATSLGTIERLSGIPDIRVGSPMGDLLHDQKNKSFICRLPQCVKKDWSKKTEDYKAAQYGGKYSTGFKLNVEAEILEGAYGKFDMARIRKNCLQTEKRIKFFEIPKKLFEDLDSYDEKQWKEIIGERLSKNLILIRLPCTKAIIASDIGTTGSASEVTIYFLNNKKWAYEYQISLQNLTIKQQSYVFEWIYYAVGGAFIALDCTNADGAAIRENLKLFKIPVEHLAEFKMNQNLFVGFELDANGKVIKDANHKPVEKFENTKVWAIQQLENLFYSSLVEIPFDEKFLTQFTAFFEKRGPTGKPSWGSSAEEHLLDSWLQFALMAWDTEYKVLNKIERQPRCPGIV